MSTITSSDAAKAVVRRNTEDVQSRGNFDVFEELFADHFVDHTTQPNMTPDKAGVRKVKRRSRQRHLNYVNKAEHAEVLASVLHLACGSSCR
jgi:Na+/phosphate symporter